MEFVIHDQGVEHEVRLVDREATTTPSDAVASALGIDPDRLAGTVRRGSTVRSVDDGTFASSHSAGEGPPLAVAVPFNRPPRSEFPIALPPLVAPGPLAEVRAASRFGWGALVVPLVLGLVMAVVFHPRMALFALFSPVMMLSNWFEDRRRMRRERRAASVDLDDELATFRRRLTRLREAEGRLRLRAMPAPALLIEWINARDTRLWERRRSHEDAMRLGLGTACVAWTPTLTNPPAGIGPEAARLLEEMGTLHDVPVPVDLAPGEVVGVTGHIARAVELTRSLLLQAATLHGPADVDVTIVTDRPDRWDWAKWLPHTVVDADLGRRRLAVDPEAAAQVLGSFVAAELESGSDRAWGLVLVDLVDLAAPRHALVRDVLARAGDAGLAAIVLAPVVTELPSVCTSIVSVEREGTCELRIPARGGRIEGIVAWRLPATACRAAARRLASLEDPDVRRAAAGVPDRVRLLDLLGPGSPNPDSVIARWRSGDPSRPRAPIAMTAEGSLMLDLVADGPHALLAGTTGSGKSELLRSLVASLAASASPEYLNFVLVDYKGGSAFDVCADLPHTVGMVTDLDGHLAQRALTCLEAELRYREHRLRDAGASDLLEFLAGAPPEPMPRLLVVIDEFAALAKELPEFMASLVDIAQRGRSLGVHLLLATQRPNGVINDNIRANTNLRIALRVQDRADSVDVLGAADAAAIGRSQPGRGYVRRGPGDVVGFQTALVTGPAGTAQLASLQPFVFAREQPDAISSSSPAGAATDLDQLVAATRAAAAQLRLAPPRRPWPDPLPAVVDLEDLDADSDQVVEGAARIGLADEPAHQRRSVVSWRPEEGNLLLHGVAGSGTSTALASIALGLARAMSSDDLHLYVLDFDDQVLSALEPLPHVGAVVGAADRERQVRLLRMLQRDIDVRRTLTATDPAAVGSLPSVVLLVDNYAGFAAAFDDPGDLGIKTMLGRIVADGPGVGIVTVASAKQPVDVPAQVASLVPAKLLFRLADRYEYTGLGVSGVDVPTLPGRAYESGTGRELHLVRPHADGIAAAVAETDHGLPVRAPRPVGTLPTEVKIADIVDAARVFDLEWRLPVGVGDTDLLPAGFTLGEGDHVLVAGPARSGKSTVLAAIAEVMASHRPDIPVVAVLPRRSPLAETPAVHHVVHDANALRELGIDPAGGGLILVDDAALVDDPDAVLAALVEGRHGSLHVVAAGEGDMLRAAYGHWTTKVRRSRLGLALRPNVAADGDLWQTTLPRRGPTVWPTGRGYLIAEGRCELMQAAWR